MNLFTTDCLDWLRGQPDASLDFIFGSPLAHENEAPFPLKLAEKFVLTCCPKDGVVVDPFIGSGTTAHAAELHGRKWIGIDWRQSQIDLTRQRIEDVRRGLTAKAS